MASFFDRVSDVLNNTANDISDKAKEISEVSSLKGQVRSQEKFIEKTYSEIGKAYYESHNGDVGDEFYESMQQIAAAQAQVEKLKKDIEIIKAN